MPLPRSLSLTPVTSQSCMHEMARQLILGLWSNFFSKQTHFESNFELHSDFVVETPTRPLSRSTVNTSSPHLCNRQRKAMPSNQRHFLAENSISCMIPVNTPWECRHFLAHKSSRWGQIQWVKKLFQCLPLLTFFPYISTISNSRDSQFWEKMHMLLVCWCTKYPRIPSTFGRGIHSTSYMGHWNSFFANDFVTPILQISIVYTFSLPETWHASS